MNREHQKLLLQLARDAVAGRLIRGAEADALPRSLPEALMEQRASFVTLQIDGLLRGCIGTLEAYRPLAEDVRGNALAAAFHDPRFPPLSLKELDVTQIHISVLSAPEELTFTSEADLLHQLRPGVDGLILQEGYRRGTFLPSVWDELPDQRSFLRHLKLKTGLMPGYWSASIRIFRYTAEYFGEQPAER